jgi:hypothetical protein
LLGVFHLGGVGVGGRGGLMSVRLLMISGDHDDLVS